MECFFFFFPSSLTFFSFSLDTSPVTTFQWQVVTLLLIPEPCLWKNKLNLLFVCLCNILDLKKECFVSRTLEKICNNFPAFVRESLCFLHLGIFSYHLAQHKSQAFPESCKAIDVHGITRVFHNISFFDTGSSSSHFKCYKKKKKQKLICTGQNHYRICQIRIRYKTKGWMSPIAL